MRSARGQVDTWFLVQIQFNFFMPPHPSRRVHLSRIKVPFPASGEKTTQEETSYAQCERASGHLVPSPDPV